MNEKEAIDVIRLQRSKGITDNEILDVIAVHLGQSSSVALLNSVATPPATLRFKRHTSILQFALALFSLVEVIYLICVFQYLLLFVPFTIVFIIALLGLLFCTINLRQHIANFYTGAIGAVVTMVIMHISRLFEQWNKLFLFDTIQVVLGIGIIILASYVRMKKFPAYIE